MKFYILIYDRTQQKLLDVREFPEDDRALAEEFRFKAQRHSIQEGLDQEIVLFQAKSKGALQRTHGSYFFSESELIRRAQAAVEAG